MDILSCDTMVALGNSTRSGNVIFAKNSDRPTTEPQPLVIIPAAKHTEGDMVKCTYIEIPQVRETYKIMGSKPEWMWGFEHGINEHGVVIGNEAVFANEEVEALESSLLGMDLLRLALERGKTAYEAMHVITTLLAEHGQGGSASNQWTFHYHNAFLIADCKEAWVLETCNRLWVAKRVNDVAGISNCYSIECDWDEDSGDIKEYAYEMGWAKPGDEFNFAKVYGAMNSRHRAAYPRYKRSNALLRAKAGDLTLEDFREIQRDHFEGTVIEPRWSPADGLEITICMHSMEPKASKTAAAAQVELIPSKTPIWWTAFGSPCLSIFAPYTIENELPEIISHAGARYSADSVWWQFEKMQILIERNYPELAKLWQGRAAELEKEILEKGLSQANISDELIRENTKLILDLVGEVTEEVVKAEVSVEPQHSYIVNLLLEKSGIEI